MPEFRRAALWAALAIALAGCQRTQSSSSSPTTPTTPQTPSGSGLSGVTVDAATDQPLSGVTVKIDGVGEVTSDATGSFRIAASDPSDVRAVTVSSVATVDRRTHVRAPGPTATLSLIPTSFDLRSFDEMARGNGSILRWVSAPPIVVQRRVLDFTGLSHGNLTDADYAATGATMSDAEVSSLVGDFTWGLPQLSGSVITGFSGETRETAAEGSRVTVARAGAITVARYRGFTAGTNFLAYTRWAWNADGELQAAVIMMDADFETSGSPFLRPLRVHELGHAMGYTHVTLRTSVMNGLARIEPNAFDRDAGKIAFRRPPLNRTPDIDPDPYSLNRARAAGLTWTGLQ
jgi:hypothetical protein